jgi:hypothetical protein
MIILAAAAAWACAIAMFFSAAILCISRYASAADASRIKRMATTALASHTVWASRI